MKELGHEITNPFWDEEAYLVPRLEPSKPF